MKRVGTQLNEKEYKELKKRVEARGETQYAMIKKLILNWLRQENAREVDLTVAYWFLCYSLIVASILLLL